MNPRKKENGCFGILREKEIKLRERKRRERRREKSVSDMKNVQSPEAGVGGRGERMLLMDIIE